MIGVGDGGKAAALLPCLADAGLHGPVGHHLAQPVPPVHPQHRAAGLDPDVRAGRDQAGPEPPVRLADGGGGAPAGKVTEVVLLNEEDQPLASWTLYGKTGMVTRTTGVLIPESRCQ